MLSTSRERAHYVNVLYANIDNIISSNYTPDGTAVVLSGSLTGTELYFVTFRLQTFHHTTLVYSQQTKK